MQIALDNSQHWLDQYANTAFIGQDLVWLNDLRQQALQHFEKVGLPGVRDEQWRYTKLRELKSNLYNLSLAVETPADLSVELEAVKHNRLVFINGHYSELHSNLDGAIGEVSFTNLKQALVEFPELLKDRFGTTLPDDLHGFTALNGAFCQDGFVLVVPKNSTLDEPLEVVFVSSSSEASDKKVSHTRNFIITESNAQCTLIERHIGIDGSVYLNNSVTEIIAGTNSRIEHYKLQLESNAAFHMGGTFIRQSGNAQVKSHNIGISGLVIRNDIKSDLLEPGCHIEMNGLVMGNDRQHFDNHTQVNHLVPHCSSDEYYKTVLDDHSRSVFRGRIVVAEDAQQTNADQQNNNLLLSDHAEADTLPQLEIYADDVKCSHGATVGQLDEKSLFYLRSRGINLESAITLLTIGFANEVLERMRIDSVRDEVKSLIALQLQSGEELIDE
ncbi:MAG: Fe-S cluster assembly protein SufD [Acidiferrobacterales bacterium]|nr:Fe-S cluster assembly protein SufD [Acidiferrobacterales bacterium]